MLRIEKDKTYNTLGKSIQFGQSWNNIQTFGRYVGYLAVKIRPTKKKKLTLIRLKGETRSKQSESSPDSKKNKTS